MLRVLLTISMVSNYDIAYPDISFNLTIWIISVFKSCLDWIS